MMMRDDHCITLLTIQFIHAHAKYGTVNIIVASLLYMYVVKRVHF